jgi:hypothetical protein
MASQQRNEHDSKLVHNVLTILDLRSLYWSSLHRFQTGPLHGVRNGLVWAIPPPDRKRDNVQITSRAFSNVL